MSDFITKIIAADTTAPDPSKHVNYVYGMVLGADDFNQEFAYLAGRDQWLARDAIGYGTLRGLQVKIEDDGANGPRVAVTPGTALNPRGQLICVGTEQCASLKDWLQANQPKVKTVKLYVTLAYRECLTDNVPIPGEPCRSEDLAMDASRTQDDFLLELRTQPPTQFEEDMLRDFVAWLRLIPLEPAPITSTQLQEQLQKFGNAVRTAMHLDSTTFSTIIFGAPDATLKIPTAEASLFWRTALRIWTTELRPRQDGLGKFVKAVRHVLTDQIAPAGGTPVTLDNFAQALRNAAHLTDANLAPGYLDEQVLEKIRIPADPNPPPPVDPANPTLPANLEDFWKAAFNVWSNEILPRWIAKGGECAWPPEESSVLLAELTMPVTTDFTVNGDASKVTVDENQRPYVLHLRMLQEWLLRAAAAGSGGGVAAPQAPRGGSGGGIPGSQGPAGKPGKDGKDGENGKDGKDGENGAPGKGAEDAVLHPPGLPAYLIVAAGIVSQKSPSRDPVYNNLKVIEIQPGLIHLTFDGYKPPKFKDQFQYMIKALPVTELAEESKAEQDGSTLLFNNLKANSLQPTVSFRAFTDQGFVLQVMVQNKPVDLETLSLLYFMVEVSQYAKGG